MTRLALQPLTLDAMQLDPLQLAARAAANRVRQQQQQVTPEEERSLLGSVLGGVEYIGSALDKPGAAARGVIHGVSDIMQGDSTPEFGGGLLNLIPFSDTFGVTDRSERVSGRDVLENWGAVGPNKPGLGLNSLNPGEWDWQNLGGDLAGFGAEVAMDPLSYVTGPLGTITKLGKARQMASPVAQAVDAAAAVGKEMPLTELAKVYKSALTSAGSTGQTAMTPKLLADQIRAGERGLVGAKLPRFVNSILGVEDVPFVTLGDKSELAAKFVEGAAYSPLSPVLWSRAIFGEQTYNKWKPSDQKIADAMFGEKDRLLNLMNDLAPTVEAERGRMLEEFATIGKHANVEQVEVRRAFDDVAREYILENPKQPRPVAEVKQALLEKLNAADADPAATPWLDGLDELTERYHGYFDTLRQTEDAMGRYAESLGLSFKWLKDEFVDHYGRRPSMKLREDMQFWKKREGYLRDVPGGTITFNMIGMDPLVTATERLKAGTKVPVWGKGELKTKISEAYNSQAGADPSIPRIARKAATGTKNQYKSYLKDAEKAGLNPWEHTMLPHPEDATLRQYQKRYLWDFHYKPALDKEIVKRGLDPADAAEFFNKQAGLAWNGRAAEEGAEAIPAKLDDMIDGFKSMPEAVLKNGLFDRSTATDYYDYMHSAIKAISNYGYMHSALKQKGIMKLVDQVDDLEPGEAMLNSIWYNTRLTKQGLRTLALDSFADKLGQPLLHPNTVQTVNDLRAAGKTVEEIETALGPNGDDFLKSLDEISDRIAVPESARGIMSATQAVSNPKVESKLLQVLDKVTAGFKGYWTIPFPAFHVRNLGAAIFQEMTDGKITAPAVLRGVWNAYKQVRSGEGLQYIDEIKALGVLDGKGWIADVSADEAIAKVGDLIPHGKTGGVGRALSPNRMTERAVERYGDAPTLLQKIKANIDPLAARGVREDLPPNIIQEAGEEGYKLVEFMARAGYYDELRKAGMSPAQSVHYVNRTHFDYSRLNPTEKAVFKRAMPFYSWTRKSLPYTMAKMLEYPGGPTSQAFRAVNRGENPEGVYTPRWMQEQIAAPVTGAPEAQTFLRSLGLPIEDYNRFVFDQGVPNFARTAQTFASNLHPLLTMPLEQMSGKQLYSGRDLKTLESPTENLLGVRSRLVDTTLQRGPWSRFVSTGMDIANPDKPTTLKLLNLTTGMKFSTVDTEKARMIDLVNAQREKLDAYPEIRQTSHFYLNPKYEGTPIGETRQEDLKLLNALQKLQKKVLLEKDRQAASQLRM